MVREFNGTVPEIYGEGNSSTVCPGRRQWREEPAGGEGAEGVIDPGSGEGAAKIEILQTPSVEYAAKYLDQAPLGAGSIPNTSR